MNFTKLDRAGDRVRTDSFLCLKKTQYNHHFLSSLWTWCGLSWLIFILFYDKLSCFNSSLYALYSINLHSNFYLLNMSALTSDDQNTFAWMNSLIVAICKRQLVIVMLKEIQNTTFVSLSWFYLLVFSFHNLQTIIIIITARNWCLFLLISKGFCMILNNFCKENFVLCDRIREDTKKTAKRLKLVSFTLPLPPSTERVKNKRMKYWFVWDPPPPTKSEKFCCF